MVEVSVLGMKNPAEAGFLSDLEKDSPNLYVVCELSVGLRNCMDFKTIRSGVLDLVVLGINAMKHDGFMLYRYEISTENPCLGLVLSL